MDLANALESPLTGGRARYDDAADALVGGRCADCGAATWPMRAICHRCGSAAVAASVLSRHGVLVSCTRVMISRPGIPAPYTLGQVRIDDGPVVFGQIKDLADVDDVPIPVVAHVDKGRYWFTPGNGPDA